ncbi:MAG: hypothetical protein QOF76_1018 [Solirubrobacteraceae bacterium]|nr:hypothetical protein [Solirubrobacteraceae bacterium]
MRLAPVLIAALLALPAPAHAAPKRPPTRVPAGLDETITTPHFLVHYTTAAGSPSAVTAAHAQELADAGERGYAKEVTEWGFPAPPDDGDGRTDIYVFDGGDAFAVPDSNGDTTTSYISYSPTANQGHIPHEFFHVIQFGFTTHEFGWLVESTADWAAVGTGAGYSSSKPFAYAHPEVPLDCTGPADTDCAGDRYGYHGNVFWESLTERFGAGLVREVFTRAGELDAPDNTSHALQALGDVLAAHGTTIDRAFGDFAIASWAGTLTLPGLAALRPDLDSDHVADNRPEHFTIGVDHLSAKYVQLSSGVERCAKATLHLTATVPAGGTAALVDGAEVTPLASGAPLTRTMNGCDNAGTLVLANGSLATDAAPFVIDVQLAQAPAPVPRASIIAVEGARPGHALHLTVRSTAAGEYRLDLGKMSWNGTLHKGTNHLAARLPRRTKPGRRSLTLTTYSPSGHRGTPVRHAVRIKR